MLDIEFEYKDELSKGKWNKQQCTMNSLKECIEWYGLGKDCEYRILKIEEHKNPYRPWEALTVWYKYITIHLINYN